MSASSEMSYLLVEVLGVLISGAGLLPNQNKHSIILPDTLQAKPVLIPSSGVDPILSKHSDSVSPEYRLQLHHGAKARLEKNAQGPCQAQVHWEQRSGGSISEAAKGGIPTGKRKYVLSFLSCKNGCHVSALQYQHHSHP